ncbi:endonuclease/exonuclease/phosphatase family protein [Danxiaibacter flavus]|uniref:Endonuclease/exonuclease/phosphatase family protein n=1 Tax=Danxiaibacter flavus TaxID=3049108 RepID=A0ABV3Z9Q7_9BACT|nr:endonuclease/exonuclease/phosphatase family protein [Chitinophagaceae bacterium DXS]
MIFTVVLCQLSTSAYTAKNSITICSWNLKDFGKSKSDSAINFIANTVKDFDILMIQEVVAGYGGAQAVAKLADILNRKGEKWDYVISEPTSGDNSYKRERYAYLWKPRLLKRITKPWLEQAYHRQIDREPFYCSFSFNGKTFTLANFHAITKSKQPQTEIKYFRFLPDEYPDLNLLFCGDFNLPQSHSVFNPLKQMGYIPALTNQKTSLRQKCANQECLASEFDNIFFKPEKVSYLKADAIHFYRSLANVSEARLISDHLPVYFEFSLN